MHVEMDDLGLQSKSKGMLMIWRSPVEPHVSEAADIANDELEPRVGEMTCEPWEHALWNPSLRGWDRLFY